jgi:hypothetical protein
MDLVQRARDFATNAHKRIDHRRKYSKQPYTTHLASVARLVASVTDDAEMIAAAWLHDVVEDTPATLYDVEQHFGAGVAALVENLTDISKPGDGNRALRKAMDRRHLAAASARAKTVKLADLIDNARDIVKHDPRFAHQFLQEMSALLDVLDDGDAQLYRQAWNTYHKCRQQLAGESGDSQRTADEDAMLKQHAGHRPHLFRLFSEAFTAQDIAEPVPSFDASRSAAEVRSLMESEQLSVVCLREQGRITGYLRLVDLDGDNCRQHMRAFRAGQVIAGDSSLSDVIHVLTLQEFGFIAVLGEVAGVFSRTDINKPVVRMWLFGIITFIEMEAVNLIRQFFPDDDWQSAITGERLQRAKEMQRERQRRGQHSDLLDCLQLGDKGRILISRDETLHRLGLDSRRAAKKVIRELESLRNNLAHAQDIITYDWAQIVRLTSRLEETLVQR